MDMDKTIEGVTSFLEKNDELIQEIRDTGKTAIQTLKDLADKIEKNQKKLASLNVTAGGNDFIVSAEEEMKKEQQIYLKEIQDVNKKIQKFKAHPEITGLLYNQKAGLYLGLANTYNQTVNKIISFSEDEVDEINIHLNRANLDAQRRQQWADILDASVQLAKAGLKIALKLVV